MTADRFYFNVITAGHVPYSYPKNAVMYSLYVCFLAKAYIHNYNDNLHYVGLAVTERPDPSTVTERPDPSTAAERPGPSTDEERRDPSTVTERPDPSTVTERPGPSTDEEKPEDRSNHVTFIRKSQEKEASTY